MNDWLDRHLHGDVALARPYLLSRALPLLLALDIWVLMVGHGARYGTAGFNVAHFAWLDVVQPIPTPGLYTGVMLLCGLLSLTIAFAGNRLWLSVPLCALYTYGWAMSMLDSYQHHYFISWMLLCLACLPEVRATELVALPDTKVGKSKAKKAQLARAEGRETGGWIYVALMLLASVGYALIDDTRHPWVVFVVFFAVLMGMTAFYGAQQRAVPMTSSWGYVLTATTIAIVYTYTTLAKCDGQWVAGHTMRQISSAELLFKDFADWAVALGMDRERFWAWLATSVIPLEALVAFAYAAAPLADRGDARWPKWLAWVGFGLAIQLHVGAEAMGLEIGWFSYYMLLLACVFLLPARFVMALSMLFAWPGRALRRLLSDWEQEGGGQEPWSTTVPMGLGTAAVVMIVGYSLDLPGALGAALAAVVVFAIVTWLLTRDASHADARRTLLGVASAAAVMWIAVNVSEVRFDYYRFLGGDLRRREQPAAALDAYIKAERYAPKGKSRKKDIDELKAQLRK